MFGFIATAKVKLNNKVAAVASTVVLNAHNRASAKQAVQSAPAFAASATSPSQPPAAPAAPAVKLSSRVRSFFGSSLSSAKAKVSGSFLRIPFAVRYLAVWFTAYVLSYVAALFVGFGLTILVRAALASAGIVV